MHKFGVILELIGAFLLAAEAIKLHNLALLGLWLRTTAFAIRSLDNYTRTQIGNLLAIAILGSVALFWTPPPESKVFPSSAHAHFFAGVHLDSLFA